jgi:transposase
VTHAMPRRNRNVTLVELQAALAAAGGSRAVAAKDLDVSIAWVFFLVRAFEMQGMVFTRSKRKRPKGRAGKVYKPTRKEIRAACKEIQAGWTPREWYMRRVFKGERLTVPWVEFDDDSRAVDW